MAMAQQGRGNGVLDLAWGTVAFGDQYSYAPLWHSEDRSASRSGTHRPASFIEGRVRFSTRRSHNPIQLHVTESCGGITGPYRGHDTAIFDTSALETTMRLASAPLPEFQLSHPSHTSWPTMSINGTATEPRFTYKEMAEIAGLIRWVASTPDSAVKPPEPVHFSYPSYNSASDHSTRRPTTPSLHEHAHHLFETYNRPARPGEFIFKEMVKYERKRQFLRIKRRNAPYVMIVARDFTGDPDDPDAWSIEVEKSYLMRDGYVELGPEGIWEQLSFAAWELWTPVTNWAGRAKVAVKATLLEIKAKGLDIWYGPRNGTQESWDEVFGV
jgi:hypothetical protein